MSNWLKKFSLIIFGAFLGIILTYNYVMEDMVYRISFYGYQKNGEEIYPIIKLRKRLSANKTVLFHPDDPGQSLEIAMAKFTQPGQSMEFTDEQINKNIKEIYCK